MSNIHEECGVFGVFSPDNYDVARMTYYGLFSLQHRGQESCGIVVNDDGLFAAYKDVGLVNDVFTPDRLDALGPGSIAVGHVRYGTTGSNDRNNAQPIVVNHVKGRMALAHNGNLVNSYELRSKLELEGSIFHTTSDTEVISYIITKERLTSGSIEEAVNRAMGKLKGAYSLVIMSPSKLIAARDEHGFRPLCYGQTADGRYVIASESCALDAVGAAFIRDIEPGEILVFDRQGVRSIRDHCEKQPQSLCVFEYIYFARPDSVIDGCQVHTARVRAGSFLALEYTRHACARGRSSRSSTPCRRTSSSACRIPASTRPSAIRASPASPMRSASSRTSISAAPSSPPVRRAARTRCASSSTPSPMSCAANASC